MDPHTIRYYLWILTIHLDRFASNRAAGWLFKGSAFLGSNQKSHLNHIKPYMYIFRDVDTLDPTKVCFLIEFCLNGIFLSVVDAQRDALYGDIWGISGITQRVSSIAWWKTHSAHVTCLISCLHLATSKLIEGQEITNLVGSNSKAGFTCSSNLSEATGFIPQNGHETMGKQEKR